MDQNQFARELERLRFRERLLWIFSVLTLVGLGSGLAFEARAIHKLAHSETLSLRRLDIVDEHGTSRVILAAPAPPPMRFGKTGKRDGPVSGVLIVDASGTERGGYVTSDGDDANAMLTLDAQGQQTVLLLAEPSGPTLFRVWNKDKGSLVMGVSGANPFLNVRQSDKVFLSAPESNPEAHDSRFLFR
jgi:hypothetical protein